MFCLQLVVLLVDHGANINQKNKRGKTPQDVAGVDLNRFLRCWKASGLFFQITIIVYWYELPVSMIDWSLSYWDH